MNDHSFSGLLSAAGHDPWLQAVVIVLGTFVLEDAATILAAMAARAGDVSPWVAFAALYLGIVVGDMGVYGLGHAARRFRWARRWAPPDQAGGRRWIEAHVLRTVFVSRFIPGARLPIYTACGFLGADFRRFAVASIGATLIWTSGLFALSLRVGGWLAAHLGAWRWAGMGCFVLSILLIGRLAARLQRDTA